MAYGNDKRTKSRRPNITGMDRAFAGPGSANRSSRATSTLAAQRAKKRGPNTAVSSSSRTPALRRAAAARRKSMQGRRASSARPSNAR